MFEVKHNLDLDIGSKMCITKKIIFTLNKLVIARISLKANTFNKSICRRNWRNYSPSALIHNIALPHHLSGDVQSIWNSLEHSLIMAADNVVQYVLRSHRV